MKKFGRDEALRLYKVNLDKDLKDQVAELKGKALSCWCYPDRCHCDYLAELANESE